MASDPLQSSKCLHMPQQILYNECEGYHSPSSLQTSTNFVNQKLRDAIVMSATCIIVQILCLIHIKLEINLFFKTIFIHPRCLPLGKIWITHLVTAGVDRGMALSSIFFSSIFSSFSFAKLSLRSRASYAHTCHTTISRKLHLKFISYMR